VPQQAEKNQAQGEEFSRAFSAPDPYFSSSYMPEQKLQPSRTSLNYRARTGVSDSDGMGKGEGIWPESAVTAWAPVVLAHCGSSGLSFLSDFLADMETKTFSDRV
jgi:hypothetical protein